jgi:hypothetical protein
VSGYLLRDTVRGAARWLPVAFLSFFVFTSVAALLGQTSLLILFLVVLAWNLLAGGRDRAAGIVLACLTIKPQLTAVLILAVFLWAIRQRRWRVIGSFLVTVALLVGICTAIVPTWPLLMLNAPRQTRPPTELYPWIGNTWFLLLRAVGAQGFGLWLPYLALAVPWLIAVVHAALDRARPLAEVFALGTLAAFFVAPYARHYDFPILVVPCFVLLAARPTRVAATAVYLALILIPFAQYFVLGMIKAAYDPEGKFLCECTFFWIPALVAGTWVISAAHRKNTSFVRNSSAVIGPTRCEATALAPRPCRAAR